MGGEEDLIIRFIGLDMLTGVVNDIGYGIHHLANQVNALSATTSGRYRQLAKDSQAFAQKMAKNDLSRATASYTASKAILAVQGSELESLREYAKTDYSLRSGLAEKEAAFAAQGTAVENEYSAAQDRFAKHNMALQQEQEARAIASRQRVIGAFTHMGTMAVMTGAVMVGVAAAIGAGLTAAATHAAKFEQQLLLIQTQAGGTAADVNLLRRTALELAPQFGYTAEQAAQAAYHIESVGLRGARAVDALKYGMMGARIAGNDLESTVNMLAVIMSSHLVPAGQSSQTVMATLDAIIGQGNMRMGDLVASFRTGLVGALTLANIKLADAGAALATLTDLGYTGATAGTALRSAITMIASPTNVATNLLKKMGFTAEQASKAHSAMANALLKAGINVTDFAKVVRDRGLFAGLTMLRDKMVQGGLSAAEMEATITKAFGGSRIGSAFKVLFENLDRLGNRERLIALNSTAAIFQQKWEATAALVQTKLGQLHAAFDNIVIIIGEALTPVVTNALGGLMDMASGILAWLTANQSLIAQLGPMVVMALAFGGAMLIVIGALVVIASMVASLVSAFIGFAPVILGVAAVFGWLVAVGVAMVTALAEGWRFLANLWDTRVVPAIKIIGGALSVVWESFKQALKDVWPAIQKAFEDFAIQLDKQGGLWDDATSAFGDFAKNTMAFVKSGAFASLVADLAVLLPAAIKVALDSVIVFADSLQLAFTLLVAVAKVSMDVASGNFAQAAKDAGDGAQEVARVYTRMSQDIDVQMTDMAHMVDGTNKAMWQKVYDDTMSITSKIGDDGSMTYSNALHKLLKAGQPISLEIRDQAYNMAYNAGKAVDQGVAKGIANNYGDVETAVGEFTNRMYQTMAKRIQAHSPSELFAGLGEMIPAGTAVGIERGVVQVEAAIGSMVGSATQAMTTPAMSASPALANTSLLQLLQEIRDGILAVDANTDPANQPQSAYPSQPSPRAVVPSTDATLEAALFNVLKDTENNRRKGSRSYDA